MKRAIAFTAVLISGVILAILVILVVKPSELPEIETGTLLEQPSLLPEINLVDHHGEAITRSDLTGKWSLLFTGFTSCPDICPATISVLSQLNEKLHAGGTEIRMILLSIDPERDTPEVLSQYIELFGGQITGITGSLSGVEKFCNEIGMSFIHMPTSNGRYTIEHSGAIVLIDPLARIAGYFRPPFNTESMAADLQAIVGHAKAL